MQLLKKVFKVYRFRLDKDMKATVVEDFQQVPWQVLHKGSFVSVTM